jgi:hypothetical protein
MICSSCKKQKHSVEPKRSGLLPSANLFMCPSCIEQKFEPRHVIVLVGREKGVDAIREYVVKRRYVGEEITARELTA